MGTHVLGTVSMVLSVAMVLVGIPLQIRKNARERRSGQPLLMTLLIFSVYVTRLVYAIDIGAWYIVVPDSGGVLLSGVMIVQYFQYRS